MDNTEYDFDAEPEVAFAAAEYVDAPQLPSPKLVARRWEVANEDGTMRTVIKSKPSSFVGTLLHLNGQKFNFDGRGYLLPIYDRNCRDVLLLCGRQCEKTTYLGNNLTIKSVIRPYNKSLYVSPSHTQTRQFSNEKLKPVLEQSPFIRRYFQDTSVSMQVFEKGFVNGSYIFLRSAFRSADRTRGISVSGVLTLDEIQDMLGSEIPVILECTSHYPEASVLMAGTPKSFDNPIQTYWESSSQNEWMVPCTACGHLNYLDEHNIAPTDWYTSGKLQPGPVCKKCQKHIDVSTGQWMTFSPGKRVQGYRISQLMVPWIVTTMDQWVKLLWKRDNYPAGQFSNEVLGISYDNASKPITRDQVIALCDPNHHMLPDRPTAEEASWVRSHLPHLIGGCDWGEGLDGSEKTPTGKVRNASYSVFTLGTYTDQKTFKVYFAKKYVGREADPDYVVRDIARICQTYDVPLIGVDYGHGFGVVNSLMRILPRGPQRVVQFQYLPKLKLRLKWDPLGVRYHAHRNLVISELFFALKSGFVKFPAWKEMEPFANDILAIFTEYVEYRREIKFDHKPNTPDDYFHALNFAKLAADIHFGRVVRI